eukprot:484099-Prymnesium_polylepis.1
MGCRHWGERPQRELSDPGDGSGVNGGIGGSGGVGGEVDVGAPARDLTRHVPPSRRARRGLHSALGRVAQLKILNLYDITRLAKAWKTIPTALARGRGTAHTQQQ